MAVIRIEKTKDYTVMSNYHLKEKNMSLKAKGLMSVMLSLPDDWDYSIEGLSKILVEGRDAIATALQELEQFGYLVRTQTQDKTGRFAGYDYTLYENPSTEKPYTENPSTEKPTQLNTNIQSTKKQNTNIKEIDKEIFDYWNSKDIIRHKEITAPVAKVIDKAFNEFGDLIKTAIDRYSQVIHDTDYYFDTRWTLAEFLKQRNAMPDFLDGGSKWVNYCNRRPKVLKQRDYSQQDYDSVFENFNNL